MPSTNPPRRFAVPAALLFASLAGCATAPQAARPTAPRDLTGFYANTWNLYAADGRDSFHINADHTWSGVFHDGLKVSGTWTLESGKACFHSPQYPDNTHCDEYIAGRRVGDTWASVEDGEEHVSVLRAGR